MGRELRKYAGVIAAGCLMVLFSLLRASSASAARQNAAVTETNSRKPGVAKTKVVRVLAVEIDPILERYGMKVSDYLYQKEEISYTFEMALHKNIENIEAASNGCIDVQIVGIQYLNEYPKYTKKVTRAYRNESGKWINKGKFNSLDEDSFLDLMRDGWWYWTESKNPAIKDNIEETGIFDYEYLFDRLSLIERKNRDEFDMVWLFGIDPLNANESTMVGSHPYWINGDCYEKDCDNFAILGFTMSCADYGIENLGHMAESVLGEVFGVSDDCYNTELKFDSKEELNLWKQFILCKHISPKSNRVYGVGLVHFAPNSTQDYDGYNDTPVLSTWIDWKKNYPNLKGEEAIFDAGIYQDPTDTYSDCECHHIWWFQMMPHLQKRTKDGYSNNWWDYIIGLDYVTDIQASKERKENPKILVYARKTIKLPSVMLCYQSEKVKEYQLNADDGCISVSDPTVLKLEGTKLTGLRKGEADIIVCMDGKKFTYHVVVNQLRLLIPGTEYRLRS